VTGVSCARRRLSLAASTLAVMTALGALLLSGQGGLQVPPLTTPGEWYQWFNAREPAEAFVALVRLGALGLGWYLLSATGAGVVARMVGARSLIRVADAVSLPPVRAVVRWIVGAGLTASTALAGSPAVAARPASPAITMTRLPDAANPAPGFTAAVPAAPSPSPPPSVTTWKVRPGQSLWQIARDVESVRQGREATDPEVAAYWRTLIDANRDLFVDRENPHLVFPGQEFRLPPSARP
jgi:nucleoid-associated protein YgaU